MPRQAGKMRNKRRSPEDVQAMIDQMTGGRAGRITPCSICGYQMLPSSLGAHASCLDAELPSNP